MSETAPPRKESVLSLPVAIVAGAILISASILFVGRGGGASPTIGNADVDIRPPAASDHIIGSPSAPVVIVEFADLQCPYCDLLQPTLKRIVEESNGEVAWVFRHFPLESIHPQARPAAEAAECVAALLGNDAFWKFTDAMYAGQGSLGAAFYANTAASLGANPQEFAQCVSTKPYASRIDADVSEAVLSGGQGTPYTIVLGKKGSPAAFSGALPYDQVLAVINAVRSRQ